MTESKTLKDLIDNEGLIHWNRLKIEAIKWVKFEIKAQVFPDISEANERWMDRFNITEEDLFEEGWEEEDLETIHPVTKAWLDKEEDLK